MECAAGCRAASNCSPVIHRPPPSSGRSVVEMAVTAAGSRVTPGTQELKLRSGTKAGR